MAGPGEASHDSQTVADAQQMASDAQQEVPQCCGNPSALRALVIDDVGSIRTMTKIALRRLGYDVQQAKDGVEGLQMLKDGTFDVVISDYEMPEMNGFDCVRHFRAWELEHRGGRQPILCFTGSSKDGPGIAAMGLEAGMDVVMEKPFSQSKLERALEQVEQV